MQFGKPDWRTFERGTEKEWLITNGIGGFASSTLIGANTRRYHGLLIAALNPPVERHLVLSKVDESITVEGRVHNLFSYKTGDYTMDGFRYQQMADIDAVPAFYYGIEDILLEKRIVMVHGHNTVCVVYKIKNGSAPSVLKLAPLVNFRDYHHTSSKQHMQFKRQASETSTSIIPYGLDLKIGISLTAGRFIQQDDCWFSGMFYPVESERGLDAFEDHYIPGYFQVELAANEEKLFTLTASIQGDEYIDGNAAINAELTRIEGIKKLSGFKDPYALSLVKAADQFIAERNSTGSKTIIAGYPWFTDWGRDTMIAFRGLTLETRRFEDAKEILETFSRYEKDGLLPNVFPDAGNEPPYNTVDAPLWYFEAARNYSDYTGDFQFIQKTVFPVLKKIFEGYSQGTHFGIHMDTDGLISAGDPGTQLTWMDACAGGKPVTPRYGKAVEINALWYNALKNLEYFSNRFKEGNSYGELAGKVKASFTRLFWNTEAKSLYDYILPGYKDAAVRPNQILAVSLSYPVIDGEMALKVVDTVWKALYTPFGLRTVSKENSGYRGVCTGSPYERDSAYHQGTVWTWLLGHFIISFIRVTDDYANAAKLLMPIASHLREACIGSVSEIFDGDEPHYPRGCFAQAWSVAELLRAYSEILKHKPVG